MSSNPRYKYFPWQSDYAAQSNLFCPYVMSLAEQNYRSKSLNTDNIGFRYQYDHSGRLIDLHSAKNLYQGCTLLLGNSTAFGVSLTRDNKTIGHNFGSHDRPWINLSVRGATMQQELATFQTFKHLLPPIERIVLLTGICDISLATQTIDIWSPYAGGMHSCETFYKQHYERLAASGNRPIEGKKAFLEWAEERYIQWRWLQNIFERRIRPTDEVGAITTEVFKTNLEILLPLMKNVMESWAWIQIATGVEISIMLQPIMGWTTKPRSPIENDCIESDIERIPAIPLYANQNIYSKVKDFYIKACEVNRLNFFDANTYFDQLSARQTIFSDICHLTDQGTDEMSKYIQQNVLMN